ncbi:MAG: PrsW family intramembrane metalloprotease [Deltaproteobacteria bacterium]|nr:MAG: PrsW family intramembrane metalloprotease [Deltaproteobacteria bacterium]
MPLVLVLLSAFFATVPMLVLLGIVWWADRYEREPVWLLTLTFLWGAIGAIFTALDGSSAVMAPVGALAPPLWFTDAVGAVLVAPFVEEPAKAIVLLFVAMTRHFDNATDGFVYGAASGLGFGMTENFLYFSASASTGDVGLWVGTVIVRTLYSAVMHATASSVVGAALGFTKFRGLGWMFGGLVGGLAVAMSIHMAWNGLLTLDGIAQAGGLLALSNFLLFPLEVLTIFLVFEATLWHESAVIRRELGEEAEQGLLPKEHAHVLASYWRRLRASWTDPRFTREYVHAATTLAVRKHQHRLLAARNAARTEPYARAVEALRDELRTHASKA